MIPILKNLVRERPHVMTCNPGASPTPMTGQVAYWIDVYIKHPLEHARPKRRLYITANYAVVIEILEKARERVKNIRNALDALWENDQHKLLPNAKCKSGCGESDLTRSTTD